EAADRLGVKPETLYAYVSRGVIERRRGPDGSTFAAADVERLARAGRRGRSLPALVFPSGLTRIEGGRVAYRGLDAIELAAERGFEEVAEWLWLGAWPEATVWPLDRVVFDVVREAQALIPDHCLPIDRLRVTTATAAAIDERRHDTSADLAVATARRLLALLVHALPAVGRRSDRPGARLAAALWPRLSPLPPTDGRVGVLDAALVLLADHELASSTLAARLAAMVRADPYEIVGAGLNVLGGSRHGGATLTLEPLLRDAEVVGVGRAMSERIGPGERLVGFGHALYRDGDPRAAALLARLDDVEPAPTRRTTVDRFLAAAAERDVGPANIDAALAAMAHVAEMRPGAAEAIFAIARTAGWIAHALEQYDQPTFMRARVDYVGA
ncbi:MAG TPA: citrate/2-methylcitrate synthase, partial [Acidimicrobiales bacterium]